MRLINNTPKLKLRRNIVRRKEGYISAKVATAGLQIITIIREEAFSMPEMVTGIPNCTEITKKKGITVAAPEEKVMY